MDNTIDGRTPARIGHYRVLRKLGEGGMGVVYAAEDERLGRPVAVKVMRDTSTDPAARRRLVREARIAASITHPLICQVFELGDWNNLPFIAMELLDGEPLAARLARGPLAVGEALPIALSVVDALSVLHGRGIVHRDLKPSNVFVTPSGLKVLDFGLARAAADIDAETASAVTRAGSILGTPQYAAPEQLSGGPVDVRADLFSAGVVLYEMLAGRPPFSGANVGALIHAVMFEPPPVLTGSPAIAAIDRILHRVLSKSPEERHQTADALRKDLRAVVPLLDTGHLAEARPILRLAVLPFRLLKPDPETDYLGLSLADALTTSLLGLESLVVRSSLKSTRYANAAPDLRALAHDLAVDVVLTGSILRVSDRMRVSAELVSVPAGDVWWSQITHVPVDAVVDLYDELARQVVASLPLTDADRTRKPQIRPASAKAFDLYLRGVQLRSEPSGWRQAHAFFDQCLTLDPGFASAWAERGRLERLEAKFQDAHEDHARYARAKATLLHALSLDPDNGVAQYYYAQLEIDIGRLSDALARLLERVRHRRAEPHVYAALVQACRYAGLLDESAAAHDHARRLDPTASTSVHHTYYMQGDFARALEEAHHANDPLEMQLLWAMGREAEALAVARREEPRFAASPVLQGVVSAVRAILEGRPQDVLAALQPFKGTSVTDGEACFYVAALYAKAGIMDSAYALLTRAIDTGFLCLPAFEGLPLLATVRGTESWRSLLERLKPKHQFVIDEFARAGGRALLGLP